MTQVHVHTEAVAPERPQVDAAPAEAPTPPRSFGMRLREALERMGQRFGTKQIASVRKVATLRITVSSCPPRGGVVSTTASD